MYELWKEIGEQSKVQKNHFQNRQVFYKNITRRSNLSVMTWLSGW